MADDILSYTEMCHREGTNLQRGMNFRLNPNYSVILMSVRPNAPYRDQLTEGGTVLNYEGHDEPRSSYIENPKRVDQPEFTRFNQLTENGKFHRAAQQYLQRERSAEPVRVYEKLRSGIWAYNGMFRLVDSWRENDGNRFVFIFKLIALEDDALANQVGAENSPRRRIIPTSVKLEVWKRDKGQCVICGSKDELHFDHIIPYSKGGTSLNADNIQLLCMRHNLAKRDSIE